MSSWILLQILIGLALLSFCGDALVRGSIKASLKFSISPLIIGLTVVAFGTSAPELVVAVQASLAGLSGLALGNVIGSNIANVLLVLGLPILFFSLNIGNSDSESDFWIMFVSTIVLIGILLNGIISYWHGIFLIFFQIIILYRSYRLSSTSEEVLDKSVAEVSSEASQGKSIKVVDFVLLILVGIVGLPVGAHYLIEGATGLAKSFSVSEEIIGLSVVAIGTSLPELATSFSAVWRKQGEVVLGNIIGSNLFNILFIVGIASLISPLEFKEANLLVSLSYLFISLVLFWLLISKSRVANRLWGFIFVSVYASYVWFLLV